MTAELYYYKYYIESLSKKDRFPIFSENVDLFLNQNKILSIVYSIGNSLISLRCFRYLLYNILFFISTPKMNKSTKIGLFKNNGEKKALQKIEDIELFLLKNRLTLNFSKIKIYLNKRITFFSAIDIIETNLQNKPQLFQVVRLAMYTGYYFSFKNSFYTQSKYYISTDSNPHGLAAMAALNEINGDCTFVAHAPVPIIPARICVKRAILYGEKQKEIYLSAGSTIENPDFLINKLSSPKVIEGEFVLVALSKILPLTEQLDELLDSIEDKVIIRFHPGTFVDTRKLKKYLISKGCLISTFDWEQDLSRTKYAIAGSSCVHLDIIAQGIPSYFSSKLDIKKFTRYPFFKDGLIPEIKFGVEKEYFNCERKLLLKSYLNINNQ